MKKKLLAVVMCLTLSLSMSATVFASELSPGTGGGSEESPTAPSETPSEDHTHDFTQSTPSQEQIVDAVASSIAAEKAEYDGTNAEAEATAVLDLVNADGTAKDQAAQSKLNTKAQETLKDLGITNVTVSTVRVMMVTGQPNVATRVSIPDAPKDQTLVKLLHLTPSGWESVDFTPDGSDVIVTLKSWSLLQAIYGKVGTDSHVHNWVPTYTAAPTATNWGYTEYTCSICGEHWNDDYVAPLGSAKGGSTSPKTEENGFAAAGLFAAAALAGCAAVYVKRKEA